MQTEPHLSPTVHTGPARGRCGAHHVTHPGTYWMRASCWCTRFVLMNMGQTVVVLTPPAPYFRCSSCASASV